MKPRHVRSGQCFYGTLEQCVEQYGGKAQFTVSAPLTFFSGARLETHRRAQSNDGSVLIVERQSLPTVCEVYLGRNGIRPQSVHPAANLSQSHCA
jgi:hypothetical protein